MKPRVYIETSFVSYLTMRPSRDLIVAAHQQITNEWWNNRRDNFELYASQLVLTEAGRGDPEAAQKRLDALRDANLLTTGKAAETLARKFLGQKVLPNKAADDALHIAIATVNGMNYLLTWNCKHIANAETREALVRISLQDGYQLPTICTPEELLGE
jgi:hypothetical protein